MDAAQQVLFSSNATTELTPAVYHILSGSFRSLSLFLLAFSPLQRTLSLVQTIDAFGPHQYIATDAKRDHAYTTSWALPPSLSSWEIEKSDGNNSWRVNHINTVPITATSSYISIPPPYTHAYSAGGPTGEAHVIDPVSGALGEKVQEVLFVPREELESADKTRVALRYGSHGIEFTPSGYAFIPVLGTNSIEMYIRDTSSGLLTHVSSNPSPRGPDAHDGPRHVKIHSNGKILYCVTEHTNYVDSYQITSTSLTYISSRSLLPPNISSTSSIHFRGDTLLLTPSMPKHPIPFALLTTTRGSTPANKGWLSVFPLDSDGLFTDTIKEERWETPTSGGKANALDVMAKAGDDSEGMWILLTDDDDRAASSEGGGGVKVLEWDGFGMGGVRFVAEWPTPNAIDERTEGKERMLGGSHAVWLN